MSGEFHLDNRLKMCASFVRGGSKLADIGTDHAYLPVWLCRRGVCPSAIAADINPEPLSRGRLTIEEAGMSGKVEARLSDGMKSISADEADDFVLAGMGGELIARIIDDCPYAKAPEKRFIMQPMTRSELLIRFLCENGYSIEKQDCCEAGGKCYTVIAASYTGIRGEDDELFYYTGKLIPRENAVHLRFIQGHINRLRKQAIGDPRYESLAQRLEEFCGYR